MIWDKTNLPVKDSSLRLKSLKNELFNQIYPYGVAQLVKKPTRFSSKDGESGLDHVYTNKPDKCSEVDVLVNGSSDHRLLRLIRHTKAEIRKPKFVCK